MQSVQLAASEIWVTLIFGVIMYLFKRELKQKRVTKIGILKWRKPLSIISMLVSTLAVFLLLLAREAGQM